MNVCPYLFTVQATLGKAFSPIYLIGPVQMMTWLNQYHDHCEEILSHVKYVRKDTSYSVQLMLSNLMK